MTHSEILMVEDNEQDAELTLRALKKRRLADLVEWVEDGQDAIDYLFCRGRFSDRDQGDVPKVVLLDLELPKVGGLEVLRAMKGCENTRLIPVVVLSSSCELPDLKSAYDLGVNSYVVKPLDFEEYTETVGNVVQYWRLMNHGPTKN